MADMWDGLATPVSQNTTQNADPWAGVATPVKSQPMQDPRIPLKDEGFWPYQRRQFGNSIDNAVDYGGKVVDSVGQGISNLADLGDSATWTGENDPNKYGVPLQNDIIQGDWSKVPKDIAGRINEGFSASPPGKLLGGIGGIIGAPIVPAIQSGVEKLDQAGIPQEFSQLALNASPLLTKGLGGESPPEASAEIPVSKAYQSTANTLIKNGTSPDALMEIARKLQGDNTPAMTLPEATGDPTLLAKQRVLGEQGNTAGANFQAFNQNRLQNELPAAKQNIVENAGQGNVSTLTDAGNTLQSGAKGIIDDAIKARTEAAKPLYQAIKANPIADEDLLKLRSDPTIENEYQKVIANDSLMERQNKFTPQIPDELKGMNPAMQAQIMQQLGGNSKMIKSTEGGLPANSIGALDQVKKNLTSQLQTLMERAPGNAMIPKLQIARSNINDTLGSSEPIYKTANDEYAAASPEITAMKNGPLGRLALSQNGENAARTFMNMTREQKQQIAPLLSKKDPQAIPQIASAILKESTDKTSDKGLGAYINAMSKDKTVRDSMQAILSPEAFEGQQALIDTLQKIQKGQPTNSTTQSKFATMQGINEEGVQGFNLKNIPTTKHGMIGGALDKVQQGINAIVQKLQEKHQTELMKVFTDPDLEQLGQAVKNITDPQAKSNATMGWLAKKVGLTGAAALFLGPVGAAQQAQEQLQKPNQTIAGPMQPMSYETTEPAKPFNSAMGDKLTTAFAKAESNNNPNAKNSKSSASGLYQFTNKTWAQMVQKYGKETGIKLSDKNDPASQRVMVRLLAKDNIASLKSTIGREPTLGEVYAAHMFGPHGASKLINADPNKEAIMLFPRQVLDANHSLFFNGKQPRTVAELQNILAKKVA